MNVISKNIIHVRGIQWLKESSGEWCGQNDSRAKPYNFALLIRIRSLVVIISRINGNFSMYTAWFTHFLPPCQNNKSPCHLMEYDVIKMCCNNDIGKPILFAATIIEWYIKNQCDGLSWPINKVNTSIDWAVKIWLNVSNLMTSLYRSMQTRGSSNSKRKKKHKTKTHKQNNCVILFFCSDRKMF